MKKSTYFYYLIKVLFTPGCWIQVYPNSKTVDEVLLNLLEKHKFKKVNDLEATIGGKEFWIANYPYACFRPKRMDLMPTRKVVMYAYDRLIEDIMGEEHV